MNAILLANLPAAVAALSAVVAARLVVGEIEPADRVYRALGSKDALCQKKIQ
jgi:hypothetical protein